MGALRLSGKGGVLHNVDLHQRLAIDFAVRGARQGRQRYDDLRPHVLGQGALERCAKLACELVLRLRRVLTDIGKGEKP